MIIEVENKPNKQGLLYIGSSTTVFNPDLTTKLEYLDLTSNYHNLEMIIKNSIPTEFKKIEHLFDVSDKETFDTEDHEFHYVGKYIVVHDMWNDAFYFFKDNNK